jgi:hypothetical protein
MRIIMEGGEFGANAHGEGAIRCHFPDVVYLKFVVRMINTENFLTMKEDE